MSKEDTVERPTSQIEPTDAVRKMLIGWSLPNINTPEDLILLREKLFSHLVFRPYDDSTKEEEKKIRWRRTGSQVLEDGYVYQGKACTDLVVSYTTLARAGGVKDTKFVKLKNSETGKVHSVGEFELNDGWYTFDVANSKAIPIKGEMSEGVKFGEPLNGSYLLWKKGRDSWDLGLTGFDTINKIVVESPISAAKMDR